MKTFDQIEDEGRKSKKRIPHDKDVIATLKTKNKKLEKDKCDMATIAYMDAKADCRKDVEKLKAENEELRKKMKQYNSDAIDCNMECRKIIHKYRTALEEIKYFVENKEADADFVIRQVEQVVDEALTPQPEEKETK